MRVLTGGNFIPQRRAAFLDQIEEARSRIDHDRARNLLARRIRHTEPRTGRIKIAIQRFRRQRQKLHIPRRQRRVREGSVVTRGRHQAETEGNDGADKSIKLRVHGQTENRGRLNFA